MNIKLNFWSALLLTVILSGSCLAQESPSDVPETEASQTPDEAATETPATETIESDAAETETPDAVDSDAAETDTAETDTAETDTAETDTAETDTAETETPDDAISESDLKPLPNPADVTREQAAQILAEALAPVSNEKQLRFNFSGATWKDVLEWYSDEADLSLQYDRAPVGSVNFRDPTRTYSTAEALDILNRLLLDRGYALVRRGRLLMMVDLEADNANDLISEIAQVVSPEDLDERADSDIVSCVFALGSMTPEDAKEQLDQMRGPWGKVIVLDAARQVKITETADKLRAIKKVLEASSTEVVEIILQNRGVDEVLEVARPLLDLEPGENTNDDIRITYNLIGDRIYATGLPSKINILQSLVEKVDKPLETTGMEEAEMVLPIFQVHPVRNADITSVFEVLQTLLQDQPDTNIAIEPTGKSIIARARPDVHQQISETIAQMDGTGKELKVVTLRRLDPSQALLTINKYFGVTEEGGGGPTVDGDPATGKLWIRGTADEIKQVEELISELEGEDALGELSGKIRILPYTGQAAEDALQQAETLWPVTGRGNRIRSISPSRGSGGSSGIPERRMNRQGEQETNTPSTVEPKKIDARVDSAQKYRFVTQFTDEPAENQPAQINVGGSDIVVQVTPAGIIIASDDTEALDAFQSLVESVATPSIAQSDLPTIFWLKYCKADETAELIADVMGGGDSTLTSMTDSLMGGLGGGMLGGLMGLGGGGGGDQSTSKSILTTSGSVNIVADARLNALFVQANDVDLQVIEMILQKVDQAESPEDIEFLPKPMLIPIIYHSAQEIAEVVKSVLGDRIAGAQSGGGGNRGGGGGQPSPQEFLAALRGGGRGGSSEKPKSELPKIALSVDERSNSLVVIATPQDFEEVRKLALDLDEIGKQAEEIVQVVQVPGTMNAEAMVEALEALLGTQVNTTSAQASGSSSSQGGSTPGAARTPSSDEIRARIDAFRSRFGGGGPGGGGPGGRGGATGGRPSGGAPGGGRPGGGAPGGGRGR